MQKRGRFTENCGMAIVPPGNFDHFRFAVEHINEAIDIPLSDRERILLSERLELVKERPFFDPDCYIIK